MTRAALAEESTSAENAYRLAVGHRITIRFIGEHDAFSMQCFGSKTSRCTKSDQSENSACLTLHGNAILPRLLRVLYFGLCRKHHAIGEPAVGRNENEMEVSTANVDTFAISLLRRTCAGRGSCSGCASEYRITLVVGMANNEYHPTCAGMDSVRERMSKFASLAHQSRTDRMVAPTVGYNVLMR